MKRVLKIGDHVYSQSLKEQAEHARKSLPQREEFLCDHTPEVSFVFYKHDVFHSLDEIAQERGRLSRYLQNTDVDFVMVDNPFSALLIDRNIRLPLLFDCIDWYDEIYLKECGPDKRYYLLRYGLLELLERADVVTAQSPVILDSLERWGLRTDIKTVIPNGYDEKIFYPYPSDHRERLRRALSSEFDLSLDGKRVVVYTGALSSQHDSLFTVADALPDDCVLLIVGDGPLLSELPDRPNVRKLGLQPPERVPDFTNIADVLIYPVDNDCSPIVVSEYLAVGKPIVAPKGRLEWLIRDGETGYLVDNSVYSWKLGIQKALDNGHSVSENARSRSNELSWQVLTRKFSDFLHEGGEREHRDNRPWQNGPHLR